MTDGAQHDLSPITVHVDASLADAVRVMDRAQAHGLPKGLCVVTDGRGTLAGVITDGDLRESLLGGAGMDSSVRDVMSHQPVSLPAGRSHAYYEEVFAAHATEWASKIRHIILVDNADRPVGIWEAPAAAPVPAHVDSIAVIGLGFVGLTLAVSLAESGYRVTGFDISPDVRDGLRRGTAHVHEPNLDSLLRRGLRDGRLRVADDAAGLRDSQAYVIAVHTPVVDGKADLTHLEAATATAAAHLERGAIVILRSTVPLGTCGSLVRETIEAESGLRVGEEVSLAFAPERTVAGQAMEELRRLPQVIGGYDARSVNMAEEIFSRLSPAVIKVGSLEEAELVKLLNNAFRDVSFAFANEVAMISSVYNLDAQRVIFAANHGYPRNPISLPSPGVGGPCLVKDPYLLLHAERPLDAPSLVDVGRRINELMPQLFAQRLLDALEQLGKDAAEASVYILGLAFKGEPETNDVRGSPSIDVIRALHGRVADVHVWDPIVRPEAVEDLPVIWRDIERGFVDIDVVAVLNNHRTFGLLDVYDMVGAMRRPGVFADGFSVFEQEEIERVPGLRYMNASYVTPLHHVVPA